MPDYRYELLILASEFRDLDAARGFGDAAQRLRNVAQIRRLARGGEIVYQAVDAGLLTDEEIKRHVRESRRPRRDEGQAVRAGGAVDLFIGLGGDGLEGSFENGRWSFIAMHSENEGYARLCERLVLLIQDREAAAEVVGPLTTEKCAELTGEVKALALLIRHPDWSDQQISRAVGVNRTTLYDWPRFKQARESMKQAGSVRRGRKDRESGRVEAADD